MIEDITKIKVGDKVIGISNRYIADFDKNIIFDIVKISKDRISLENLQIQQGRTFVGDSMLDFQIGYDLYEQI